MRISVQNIRIFYLLKFAEIIYLWLFFVLMIYEQVNFASLHKEFRETDDSCFKDITKPEECEASYKNPIIAFTIIAYLVIGHEHLIGNIGLTFGIANPLCMVIHHIYNATICKMSKIQDIRIVRDDGSSQDVKVYKKVGCNACCVSPVKELIKICLAALGLLGSSNLYNNTCLPTEERTDLYQLF